MAKTKEQIRHEIEETRLRMGDTLEALMYKADVKSRARESLHEARESTADAVHRVRRSFGDGARDGSSAIFDYGRRHPTAVGAAALAAAVAVAGALFAGRKT